MTYYRLDDTFGRHARNRLEHAGEAGKAGALAALETFYFAFNNRDLETFRQVWVTHDLIRLKNPFGGVLEGIEPVTALYGRVFNGPARDWVEFHDIVAYQLAATAVVFSDRERGEFTTGEIVVPLDIRTSRIFHFHDDHSGQVHHHGSITDTEVLDTYCRAVQS